MPEVDTFDIELKLLLEGIFLKYKADFRHYTHASVRRRITLALTKLHCPTVSQLQEKVLSSATIFDQLLQILTVPTSEMFRDPSYYRALREEVIPILMTYPSVKLWIAGCSTGEELYSMAIMLKEEGLLERTIIYATDINPTSLAKAQAGIFPLDQIKHYTASYQKAGGKCAFSDYYQAAYGLAIFDQSLRNNVVFADHSLATDSVFAEVQLISCRNVLIYFDRELQNRAFQLFRDSLCHLGYLGLGSKETLQFSTVTDAFEEAFPRDKIYRRRAKP